ncbi:MAG: chemotaxis protein CheW [Acidobacteriota bacterium]
MTGVLKMADEKETLTARPEPENNKGSDWLFTGAEIRALHQTGSTLASGAQGQYAAAAPDAQETADHLEALFDSEMPFDLSLDSPNSVETVESVESVETETREREAETRIERVTRALRPIEAEAVEEGVALEKQIVFSLASVRYAVQMANILEIAELNYLTSVPNLPEWIVGVTNLRGDILSVLDFRAFLGLPQEELTDSQRMLVSQTTDGEITTGIIVDSVLGMETIDMAKVSEAKAEDENRLTPFVKGARKEADGEVKVIDLEALLRSLENMS